MTPDENDKYIKAQKEAIHYQQQLLAGRAKWRELVERIGNNHDKNS